MRAVRTIERPGRGRRRAALAAALALSTVGAGCGDDAAGVSAPGSAALPAATTSGSPPTVTAAVVERAAIVRGAAGGDGVLAALIRNGGTEAVTVAGRLTVVGGGVALAAVAAAPITLLPGQLGAFVEPAGSLPPGATLEVELVDESTASSEAVRVNRGLRTGAPAAIGDLAPAPAPCPLAGTVSNELDAAVRIRVSFIGDTGGRIVVAGLDEITVEPGRQESAGVRPPDDMCPARGIETLHVFADPV